MSHRYTKIQYEEMGAYGSVEKKTLYCHENLSCDVTSFYDHNGMFLFCFEDTMDNNLFAAMKTLLAADNPEHATVEELKMLGLINP